MSYNSRLKEILERKTRERQLFPSLFKIPQICGASQVLDTIKHENEMDTPLGRDWKETPQYLEELRHEYNKLLNESETAHHVRQVDTPWQSSKKVRLHFFWGDRGSGKSSSMEETAELYYRKGMNIWHIWAARSYENLFWPINMNCRKRYKEFKEKMEEVNEMLQREPYQSQRWLELNELIEHIKIKLEDLLHCDCHEAFPILWIAPPYIDFDMDTIHRFNGKIWKSWDEFKEAVENGWIGPEISREDRIKLFEGKLWKPVELHPKIELIKIVHLPIPKNNEAEHSFKHQFVKAILEARDEHRIVVMNPQIFQGDSDKFKVLGEIFKLIPDIADEHFTKLNEMEVARRRGETVPVPEEKWTPWERGWDKIVVVINELRTVAPNNKFSPQKHSTDTKRPIVDLIPEMRHVRVWFLGDLQNPDDLNSSVRPQADNVVIKAATQELLGQEWTGFFSTIASIREKEFAKRDFEGIKTKDDEKRVPDAVREWVDNRYPRIEELPKNKGYVVYRNGEFLLQTFHFPSFHHKKEDQKFREITGIRWTINEKKLGKTSSDVSPESDKKGGGKDKKAKEKEVYSIIVDLRLAGKEWDEIPTTLKEMEERNEIPITSNSSLRGNVLCNKIRAIPELREKLDASKNKPKK